jgi:hypothetical protein
MWTLSSGRWQEIWGSTARGATKIAGTARKPSLLALSPARPIFGSIDVAETELIQKIP